MESIVSPNAMNSEMDWAKFDKCKIDVNKKSFFVSVCAQTHWIKWSKRSLIRIVMHLWMNEKEMYTQVANESEKEYIAHTSQVKHFVFFTLILSVQAQRTAVNNVRLNFAPVILWECCYLISFRIIWAADSQMMCEDMNNFDDCIEIIENK